MVDPFDNEYLSDNHIIFRLRLYAPCYNDTRSGQRTVRNAVLQDTGKVGVEERVYNCRMPPRNPCLTCGACCAFFRVSFYWLEAEPATEDAVPVEFTEDLPPHRMCMKGTNQKKPRCVALTGEVGAATACSIYRNRPSPCRDFGIHEMDDGRITVDAEELVRCNHARAAWNLPPIVLEQYQESAQGDDHRG